MTRHKWADLIHAWADGAEIEYRNIDTDTWMIDRNPWWNVEVFEFRLHDPYRELKEAAKDPTKEVLCMGKLPAEGASWQFDNNPILYEIRDKPKAKRKVKVFGWIIGDRLVVLQTDDHTIKKHWLRVPSEDREIEVEEKP